MWGLREEVAPIGRHHATPQEGLHPGHAWEVVYAPLPALTWTVNPPSHSGGSLQLDLPALKQSGVQHWRFQYFHHVLCMFTTTFMQDDFGQNVDGASFTLIVV